MALTDLPVVRVMPRGHLHRAGTELHRHRIVGHDRDLPAHERQPEHPANLALIALVPGVHRHRRIAEHRLRPRRCDNHVVGERHPTLAHHWVPEVVELCLLLLVVDLEIAQRRLAARTPVNHSQAAINEPVAIEIHERRPYGLHDRRVERENIAFPVGACSEPGMLLGNPGAILANPHPGSFDKGLAADVMAREPLPGKFPFDDVLGGDTGMVFAGDPQHTISTHPVPAHKRVRQGIFETMTKVEFTRHVWRRHDDAVGVTGATGLEITGLAPHLIDAAFYFLRLVSRG